MHALASSLLARTFSLTPLGRAYERASRDEGSPDFSTRALSALDVTIDVATEELRHIPASGPLVIVANHPCGAADGLLLMSLLNRVRSDLKLLGNSLLRFVPGLQSNLLPLDVFGGTGSIQRNASALRQAMRWLKSGGAVLVFPAGEVAHEQGRGGNALDSTWQPTAAELAARTNATLLPMFIAGGNSRLFRAAGEIHPLLRTAMLPRELWRVRGRTIPVRCGPCLRPDELASIDDADARTAVLRARVERLAAIPARHLPPEDGMAPVAVRGNVGRLSGNIAALSSRLVLESGSYQVFCAPAPDLTDVLPEIGRLRELTFRHAGEGTGLPRDLDRFDETYEHLFVWDRMKQEIVGAYRIGATDVVAAGGNVSGLYTRTLFDYDARLLDEIGPALELGRAFVQPAYQRDFSPLLLLWKGISRVVARSGRYRRLFGVVSVSDRYDSTSRQLLVKFLQGTKFHAGLGRLVRAKNPPPLPRDRFVQNATVTSLDQVSALIRRIEPDGKDIPILLRQYLKLNARLLGFTVDENFGNVLDGLVLVDLADVEPAILSRYMGRAETAGFMQTLRRAG